MKKVEHFQGKKFDKFATLTGLSMKFHGHTYLIDQMILMITESAYLHMYRQPRMHRRKMFFKHDRIVSFVCGQFQDYLNVTQFYLNDQLIEDLHENTEILCRSSVAIDIQNHF